MLSVYNISLVTSHYRLSWLHNMLSRSNDRLSTAPAGQPLQCAILSWRLNTHHMQARGTARCHGDAVADAGRAPCQPGQQCQQQSQGRPLDLALVSYWERHLWDFSVYGFSKYALEGAERFQLQFSRWCKMCNWFAMSVLHKIKNWQVLLTNYGV